MFCPTCGVENAQGQKFCRRCGANLMAFDLAQNFIHEVAAGNAAKQVEPNSILKITALISILGFLFITTGAIILSLMQYEYHAGGPPIGFFLAMFGYGSIVLICRRLLKLLEANRSEIKPYVMQPALPLPTAQPYTPPNLPSQTNRNLGVAPIYHSITEQETQQFEAERRAKS